MRIVYLAAGAADMYCGSCLHDNTLAAAMRAAGADVLLTPTYTPIRTDEESVSEHRVFYGGINVYLQQHAAWFRHTPWFFDRLLDSPGLISWLSRRGGATRAEGLGALTVSMLKGEEGRQRKELAKLVHWLEQDARPGIVHLSNAMLVGMAREIRERLGVPVVATLSGEDVFLEKLPEPYYTQARDELRRRAAEISGWVSLNRYFADYMSRYLDIPRERIEVIPHGLQLAGHGTRRPRSADGSVTIGYFARICPEKGLHHLVEAFSQLRTDKSLPPLKLRAAGYCGTDDQAYLDAIHKRAHAGGFSDRFEYAGELDRQQKIAFLQSLDLMSVPTVYHESKGISILEAMANAVPLVLPSHGVFPELIEDTGGGLLCAPDDPASLANAIRQLILDTSQADELGRRGQRAIQERYTAEVMARRTLDWYGSLLGQAAADPTGAIRMASS